MKENGMASSKTLSIVLGWAYFLSWSASFYPQPILNYRRKSTTGLAIDYPTLNVLGFTTYTISTTAFLFSPTIKDQYAARHPHAPVSTVRFNDFAFALHGLILVLITYSQFFPLLWHFEVSKLQHMSTFVRLIVVGSVASVTAASGWVFYLHAAESDETTSQWDWIDVMYILSYVKLIATVSKYVPQAWVNYKRKSTRGWSIYQILADFAGSVLSLLQLLIDASFNDDWSGVTGNPIKFGLANASLFFDIIFILQHYVLYRTHRSKPDQASEHVESIRQPLLATD